MCDHKKLPYLIFSELRELKEAKEFEIVNFVCHFVCHCYFWGLSVLYL